MIVQQLALTYIPLNIVLIISVGSKHSFPQSELEVDRGQQVSQAFTLTITKKLGL